MGFQNGNIFFFHRTYEQCVTSIFITLIKQRVELFIQIAPDQVDIKLLRPILIALPSGQFANVVVLLTAVTQTTASYDEINTFVDAYKALS